MHLLKTLRKQKGLTQSAAGELVGVSAQIVSLVENGKCGTAVWEARLVAAVKAYRRPAAITGAQIRDMRMEVGLTQKQAGLMVGITPYQVSSLERGLGDAARRRVIWDALQAYAMSPSLPTEEPRPGHCRETKCGSRLFPRVEDVPKRWPLEWHVDFDGYCPTCAAKRGCEDAAAFVQKCVEWRAA